MTPTQPLEGLVRVVAPSVQNAPQTKPATRPKPEQASDRPKAEPVPLQLVPPEGDMVEVTAAQEATETREAERERVPSPQEKLTERLGQVVDDIMARSTFLRFQVDETTSDVVVSIVNKESGEIIRQIPPEEIIHLRAQLGELRGVVFHQVS